MIQALLVRIVASASLLCGGSAQVPSTPVADEPLPAYRAELLDLAFRTASAMPSEPHLKNRCRAQAAVVEACFELDQPRRALGYVEQISNWRRGAGYADFAVYCARHGDADEARRYADRALEISAQAEKEGSQDWQQDRIRAKVASASTGGAKAPEKEDVDALLVAVDAVVLKGDFDQIRSALEDCARGFDAHFADVERRTRLERKLKSSWDKLPIAVRMELMMELAGFALGHEDRAKALELVNDARTIVDRFEWKTETLVPVEAKLAALRFRAGDAKKARTEVDGAWALFDSDRASVVDIYRARTLRPVAEAYHAMGDRTSALKVYRAAVGAGVENPNSRPRAEDLSATCCSMARSGFEPDEALRARLLEIFRSLGPPW